MNRIFLVLSLVFLVACIRTTVTPPPSPLPTVPPSPLVLPTVDTIVETTQAMEVDMDIVEILAIAAFLALVANRLIEALIVPVFDKFSLDKFWLLYVSWCVGGVLVWLSGVNLFAAYLPNPLVGQILTALVAGGGANFLDDLFDRP